MDELHGWLVLFWCFLALTVRLCLRVQGRDVLGAQARIYIHKILQFLPSSHARDFASTIADAWVWQGGPVWYVAASDIVRLKPPTTALYNRFTDTVSSSDSIFSELPSSPG